MRAAAPDELAGAAAFPWDEAMAIGLGRTGLGPAAFWALTPREFAAVLQPFSAKVGARPSRAGLNALMARFPD